MKFGIDERHWNGTPRFWKRSVIGECEAHWHRYKQRCRYIFYVPITAYKKEHKPFPTYQIERTLFFQSSISDHVRAYDLGCLIIIKNTKHFRNSVCFHRKIRMYSCLAWHSRTSSWWADSVLLNHASVRLVLSRSVSLSRCMFLTSDFRTKQIVQIGHFSPLWPWPFASYLDLLHGHNSCQW